MINYVFPGTFDPITYGHFSVINKFSSFTKKNDEIIIAISSSPMKKPFLSLDERFKIIESILLKKNNQSENATISVEKIIGNTAEFINKKKAICIRGIRNIDDLKYESYWPVSRSSKYPVDIFLLIPILNHNSNSISSTFFKNQFNSLIAQDSNYHKFHEQLKNIAPIETIDIFYKKYFLDNKDNYDNDTLSPQHTHLGSKNSNIVLNSTERIYYTESQEYLKSKTSVHESIKEEDKINNSSIIADFNVLDNGHINFIKNSLNLADKLTIFIPEQIEHQKILFEKRFNLIKRFINELKIPIKNVVKCKELKSSKEIVNLLKSYNINQIFFEMREYHTRNEQRLVNIFDQMQELSTNNIDLIITLQEKFRDISQPLIFNIGHDDYEGQVPDETSMLKKYIPEFSHEMIKEFLDDFSKK
jgi:cytidyltransferase-like protein